MLGLDLFTSLYVAAALQFHTVLLIHFSLRRWRFDVALRYGWIVYALSIPSAALSVFLLVEGEPWWMWTGGLLYLAWAVFGFIVEYVRRIEWRSPVAWPVLVPYLLLYLSTTMFYWWPLARINGALWFVATVLFIAATILNLGSHRDDHPTSKWEPCVRGRAGRRHPPDRTPHR